MRKVIFQLAALGAAVLFGLLLAADEASASTQDGPPTVDQSQKASNDNDTKQKANAAVSSEQKNVNTPGSLLGFLSGNGAVNQSNKAENEAEAENENATVQGVVQSQEAEVEGDAKGDKGDRGKGRKGDRREGPATVDQSQKGSNDNETTQKANAAVSSEQKNVNAPGSLVGFLSGNGDVNQSNKAENEAEAENENATVQGVVQSQEAEVEGDAKGHKAKGHKGDHSKGGKGDHGEGTATVDQAQKAFNDNETEQKANAEVRSKQLNVNAPISVLSFGSNNGDVNQSNKAENEAEATNANLTGQGIAQGQEAEVEDGKGKGHGDDTTIDQSQKAANDNATKQKANAGVESSQVNVNMPIALLAFGSNNGDVNQSNKADNEAAASNANLTGQGIIQGQEAEVEDDHGKGHKADKGHKGDKDDRGKGHKPGCGCTRPDRHTDGATIDQSQKAANDNETKQKANAEVRSKQLNVNKPLSLLSLWSNNGDVNQSNKAENEAEANNANGTLQLVGQLQRLL